MSNFWSWWVMALVVLNLGVTFLLFLWGPRARIPTLPDGTTGHVWAHGVLREGLHRLPRWWLVMSLSTYVAAVTYLVLYPGFGAYRGALGWTAQSELARERVSNTRRLEGSRQRDSQISIEDLARDTQVLARGSVLFLDNCAACHGRAALGNPLLGAPNLTDDDWLRGGEGTSILTSILDGRAGAMPPWGPQFGEQGVENLAHYVLSLSGAPHDATAAAAGKALFTVCAACHGADGKGNPLLGAPNLTDSIWLYGGDLDAVEASIRDGRAGTMPSWRQRLSTEDARAVAAYVYSLAHRNPSARK